MSHCPHCRKISAAFTRNTGRQLLAKAGPTTGGTTGTLPWATAKTSTARKTTRFLREARAAVKIKSEHVARVTDVGQLDNGAPYIVDAEHIGGRYCLYRWHIESPLAFEKSIRVTMEHGHANHRSDNYYSVAYWYQAEPHAPFPVLRERQ